MISIDSLLLISKVLRAGMEMQLIERKIDTWQKTPQKISEKV
jgi:hypothetical protein